MKFIWVKAPSFVRVTFKPTRFFRILAICFILSLPLSHLKAGPVQSPPIQLTCEGKNNQVPANLKGFFSNLYCCNILSSSTRIECLKDNLNVLEKINQVVQRYRNALELGGKCNAGVGGDPGSLPSSQAPKNDAEEIQQLIDEIEWNVNAFAMRDGIIMSNITYLMQFLSSHCQ